MSLKPAIAHTQTRLAGALVALVLLLGPATVPAQLSQEEMEALDRRITEYDAVDPLENPERRAVFVLTAYSKTNFFIDHEGHYRGFEYDIVKGYEEFINRGKKKASERYHLVFIPMQFEDILPALAAGRGHMAAANFTITEERARSVDFADPYLPSVDEIVITHRNGPSIETVDDLAGRSVYVLAGSSYVESLKALNERLIGEGREPVQIVEADPDLGQSEIFELIDSGIVDLSVADNHIATAWSQIFKNLVLKPDVAVSSGGRIAWPIRKDLPKFKASVNAYVKEIEKGTLKGNMAFNSYYKSRRWLKNPLDPNELGKLEKVVSFMKQYSEHYGWDWIAIAAQAYQESQLDQSKVSPAGAVGIMQLLPSTASQKPIKIEDITKVENNIHAGVKYLSFLRRHYFDEPDMSPAARVDFSWAAYNAGPTRIQRLRRRAKERGYDPNQWFNNVEHMAAESIGRETVDYVARINKYYIAYKFALERQERLLSLRQEQAEKAELARHEKALQAWRQSYSQRSD
jgi:membrane-bound lytic murein transglycosylase MltF